MSSIKLNAKTELEMYRQCVEDAFNQIVITDKDGIIIYANNAVKRVTGFSLTEILGKKVGTKKLWGGIMAPEFYKNLWRTIKHEKSDFVGEIQNRRKNGELYTAEVTISPVFDSNGEIEYFIGIERDITKQKELEQAQTSLVSIASHQLRTPLTVIHGVLAELEETEGSSKIRKELIRQAREGEKRMGNLVNDLLDLSKIELGGFKVVKRKVNVDDFLRNIESEVVPIFDKKKQKLVIHTHRMKFLYVDPELTHEAVINLLTNASKYSSTESEIHLRLELQKKDNEAIISVQDFGIGIKKEDQPNIFNRFYRSENAKEADPTGAGLGLVIAKSIVESSGGRIWFESELGVGTTFYISIPQQRRRIENGK